MRSIAASPKNHGPVKFVITLHLIPQSSTFDSYEIENTCSLVYSTPFNPYFTPSSDTHVKSRNTYYLSNRLIACATADGPGLAYLNGFVGHQEMVSTILWTPRAA
ncbi:hypothetical protein K503DRAFT_553693 [Rhizopogon vinicolor AM-OR11-026]|uniref:Uncharacterized protein n=1 Tax=Rhizopogon vinicolor AM-OR11-026 TaxID=1314800 RepID=A0A1B7MKH2_9AGAM|nr:hypothetical protein K503DRAFT_553693 [Rhizopogon vinicolor AM-OR11-026]